jgi:type I restriction enzyme, S subunit
MEPYPRYRPSGTEWLEELPEHWTNSTLGFECSVMARLGWKGLKAEEYVESGYIFLATPNIKGNSIDFDDVNYITVERYEESPEIMLEVGDVLVTKDGSTTGTTNLVTHLPGPATVNSSIAVLRSFEKLDSGYLYQFFTSNYVQNVINRMRGGMGVPHLFQADLRKFFVSVPPRKEQTQIAKFLDYETATIDSLIEKQQQLIALLKEKRQAVISHAVTKGLNPDVPMRDSGIAWLGEVPAHWVLKPLKYLGQIVSGFAFKSHTFTTSGVRVLKIANIQTFTIDWSDESFLPRSCYEEHKNFAVLNDDIVFALTRPIISTGLKAAIADIQDELVLLNQRNAIFRPTNSLNKNFFYHVLFSGSFRIDFEGMIDFTGQQPNISPLDIANIRIPLPPTGEQEKISSYLDYETEKFLRIEGKSERAINLLRERRTALVSAAVTGKIDVRGWKAPESEAEAEAA